jgi:hypothetical protein
MASARIPVFFSFHFGNDAMRVQQVRNIGALDRNEPVSASDWETVRQGKDPAIKKWIDDNMANRRCVVVLIGADTHSRPWVQYEIRKAWNDHRGLIGVYIDQLKCPRTGVSARGPNPFASIPLEDKQPMSNYVPCYDPGTNAYSGIASGLEGWVNKAVAQAKAWWP